MTTDTWEAPRGPGPAKLMGGVPLLLLGAMLAVVLQPESDAGEAGGAEAAAHGLVVTGLVPAVVGLVLSVAGARTRLRRRRIATQGVRGEGTVTERRSTTIQAGQNGARVVKLTVALDGPSGQEVVVREIGGAQEGRRVVVRYDPDDPGCAVLVGKARTVIDSAAVRAFWEAWKRGERHPDQPRGVVAGAGNTCERGPRAARSVRRARSAASLRADGARRSRPGAPRRRPSR